MPRIRRSGLCEDENLGRQRHWEGQEILLGDEDSGFRASGFRVWGFEVQGLGFKGLGTYELQPSREILAHQREPGPAWYPFLVSRGSVYRY